MKALQTALGIIGPFQTVDALPDGWLCDGVLFPASVVGSAVVLDDYTPPPAPPAPAVVPQAVTMRQARLALLAAGLLPAVSTALAALPSPQKEAAQIEWEYSTEVQRHRPLVQALGPALGLDDAALDALFIEASQL